MCKILIVEDSDFACDVLKRVIAASLSCAEIWATGYLNTAKELMVQEEFDLILLDLNVFDSYGVNTFKSLNASCPVIVVSGEDSYEVVRDCLELGAVDYIPKPYFNHVNIINKIKYACEFGAARKNDSIRGGKLEQIKQIIGV